MKIKDLIAKLETCEELYGNIDVVIAADSEGNSFSTIDDNILHSKVYANEAVFLACRIPRVINRRGLSRLG